MWIFQTGAIDLMNLHQKIGRFSIAWVLSFGQGAVAADATLHLDYAKSLRQRGQYLLSTVHISPYILEDTPLPVRQEAYFLLAKNLWSLEEKSELLFLIDHIPSYFENAQRDRLNLLGVYANLKPSSILASRYASRWELWKNRKQKQIFDKDAFALAHFETATRQQFSASYQYRVYQPWLAGTLSGLVPGAGQLYGGKPSSAAVALVLNAIFAYSTYEFLDRDFKGAAMASGLIFSVTYFGNIINAVKGAQLENENHWAATDRRLLNEMFPELN